MSFPVHGNSYSSKSAGEAAAPYLIASGLHTVVSLAIAVIFSSSTVAIVACSILAALSAAIFVGFAYAMTTSDSEYDFYRKIGPMSVLAPVALIVMGIIVRIVLACV